MPTYQIDIEKSALNPGGQTVFWTNVYHCNAADQAAAVVIGNSLVVLEKTVHAANTTFTKMRTNNVLDDGMSGTITPLTGVGGRTTPSDFLPMYCVARVDQGKATGRPNRKYLRVFVGEGEQSNGLIGTTLLTLLNNSYGAPMVAMGVICDEAGRLIINSQAISAVQMRQLRRGSKRRITPVI